MGKKQFAITVAIALAVFAWVHFANDLSGWIGMGSEKIDLKKMFSDAVEESTTKKSEEITSIAENKLKLYLESKFPEKTENSEIVEFLKKNYFDCRSDINPKFLSWADHFCMKRHSYIISNENILFYPTSIIWKIKLYDKENEHLSDKGRISVLCQIDTLQKVIDTSEDAGAYHDFLIYVPDVGPTRVIRGGPQYDWGDSQESAWGKIIASESIYDENSRDYDSSSVDQNNNWDPLLEARPHTLVYEGTDADQKWAAMTDWVDDFTANKVIAYVPTEKNSNSVIHTALF